MVVHFSFSLSNSHSSHFSCCCCFFFRSQHQLKRLSFILNEIRKMFFASSPNAWCVLSIHDKLLNACRWEKKRKRFAIFKKSNSPEETSCGFYSKVADTVREPSSFPSLALPGKQKFPFWVKTLWLDVVISSYFVSVLSPCFKYLIRSSWKSRL